MGSTPVRAMGEIIMALREVVESIVRDLNNLELKSTTIQKIAFSYTEKQIEIVLNHLRRLSERK